MAGRLTIKNFLEKAKTGNKFNRYNESEIMDSFT